MNGIVRGNVQETYNLMTGGFGKSQVLLGDEMFSGYYTLLNNSAEVSG